MKFQKFNNTFKNAITLAAATYTTTALTSQRDQVATADTVSGSLFPKIWNRSEVNRISFRTLFGDIFDITFGRLGVVSFVFLKSILCDCNNCTPSL